MVFENISFRDKFGEERKLEFNNFYCVDCMKVLKLMPNKSIDLCIVDPPYGIGASSEAFTRKGKQRGRSLAISGLNYKSSNWDNQPPSQEYFNELFRVSKNQIIWGANHFIEQFNKNSSCWIVWDKLTGDNSYADCELAWTSYRSAVRKFSFMWKGMFQGDMKNKEKRIHPTQKPVALYEWLLQNYAKKGDKILDTHCGSASSLIACHKLGFQYVGFELDEDYYKASLKRLNDEKSRVSLFDEPITVEEYKQDSLI